MRRRARVISAKCGKFVVFGAPGRAKLSKACKVLVGHCEVAGLYIGLADIFARAPWIRRGYDRWG